MSLRVGIDVWPALTHPPGLGRWVRELVRALVALDDAPDLALLDVGPGPEALPRESLGLAVARRATSLRRWRFPRRALDGLAMLGWPADRLLGGVDVFQRVFASSPPLGDVAQIVPIFELPPRGSPEEAELGRQVRAIGNVLVASASGGRAVVERLGLAGAAVWRAPVACDHWTRDLGREHERTPRPRLLVLGAQRARRRPDRVVDALARLRSRGIQAELAWAGRRGDASEDFEARVARRGLRDCVRTIESPSEHELARLVAGSAVLVHLNDEELTAVTPLEAFSFGVAVVASRLDAFEEDLGGLACLIEAAELERDENALADAIAAQWTSAFDAADVERRRAHAAKHRWSDHARAVADAWRAIAARR